MRVRESLRAASVCRARYRQVAGAKHILRLPGERGVVLKEKKSLLRARETGRADGPAFVFVASRGGHRRVGEPVRFHACTHVVPGRRGKPRAAGVDRVSSATRSNPDASSRPLAAEGEPRGASGDHVRDVRRPGPSEGLHDETAPAEFRRVRRADGCFPRSRSARNGAPRRARCPAASARRPLRLRVGGGRTSPTASQIASLDEKTRDNM